MELSDNTKEFWKKLKVGDIISLQDKQAIEDQMEEGKELGETDYEVRSIKTFVVEGEHGCLAEYLLIEADREDETIYISVKIVDQDISLRVFFEVDEFEQGNRTDILDRGDEWIFKEPEDTEDFDVAELEYAKTIKRTIDDDEIEFTLLPQGELNGSCTIVPEESGVGDVFITLSEYSTDIDCDNPYLLITEEEVIQPDEIEEEVLNEYAEDYGEDSDDDDDDGGVITLFLGSDLSPLDLNVYPKTKN